MGPGNNDNFVIFNKVSWQGKSVWGEKGPPAYGIWYTFWDFKAKNGVTPKFCEGILLLCQGPDLHWKLRKLAFLALQKSDLNASYEPKFGFYTSFGVQTSCWTPKINFQKNPKTPPCETTVGYIWYICYIWYIGYKGYIGYI